MQANARIVVVPGAGGAPRAAELRTPPPLGGGMAVGELHLLGTAAGPLGGDRLRLELEVRSGVRLTVRSVAATVALRGDGTASSHDLDVHVAPGAGLRWLVEPLVAAAGCDHAASATVALEGDATLVWREELVLGRSGEQPGRCTSSLRICRDGRPVLHHQLSTALPGWDSPAVTAGARVLGQEVRVGARAGGLAGAPAGARAALLELDDDVQLAVGLARDHAGLRRALAPALPAATAGLHPAGMQPRAG